MASSDSKSFSSSNIISMEQLRLCTDPIWTDRELQFLRDNYTKLTYNELATRLNRSKRAIENRIYNFKLRKSGTRWTTADVQYLKDNYDIISIDKLSRHLDRSYAAIRSKARKCQLRIIIHRWTTKEIQYLKDHNQTQDLIELASQLQRTPVSICKKAERLGLEKRKGMPRRRWTEEEVEYLKKNVNTLTNSKIAIHLKRHPDVVSKKIIELKLRPKQKKIEWTEKEIHFLKKNYLTMSLPELADNLNHSQYTIYNYAYKLNVTRKRRRWTENEVIYLKENYQSSTKELALHLGRPEITIKCKVSKLGLKKEIISPEWTEEEKGYLSEHFGKLSLSELSKKLGHDEGNIKEKTRELFPIAERPKIFIEILKKQVAEITIDGEEEKTIQQIKKWAKNIGRGFCRYERFKYLRLQSYRLMVKAVIAEAYERVTRKEEIPFEKEWEAIRQKRYALRKIIYKANEEKG